MGRADSTLRGEDAQGGVTRNAGSLRGRYSGSFSRLGRPQDDSHTGAPSEGEDLGWWEVRVIFSSRLGG